jgi:hypothetical protein
LTIYKDGVETEQIELYNLKTQQQMHALFQDKGFVIKTAEDMAAETIIGGAAAKPKERYVRTSADKNTFPNGNVKQKQDGAGTPTSSSNDIKPVFTTNIIQSGMVQILLWIFSLRGACGLVCVFLAFRVFGGKRRKVENASE